MSILNYFPKDKTPRDPQRDILLWVEKNFNKYDVFVINAPVACHRKGEKVLMYDGSIKKIEELVIGDKLMGADSQPRNVTGIHKGIDDIYEIRPFRSKSWYVTGTHILNLKVLKRKQKGGKRWTETNYENISVHNYINKADNYKRNAFQHCASVDFSEKNLPIDPYILGIWLGDGTHSISEITNDDPEVISAFMQEALKRNLRFVNRPKTYTYAMVRYKNNQDNNFLEDLKKLNLYKNKHIPNIYLTSSKEQRLQLLAGLLDTDGSRTKDRNSIEFSQKRELLFNQVIYLCRSLGISANKRTKVVNGITYYRTSISSQIKIPLKVERKKLKLSISNQLNEKFTVTNTGKGEFYGVSVDRDHLYLTDQFVVTHNSGKSLIATTISKWLDDTEDKKSMITVPTKILQDQYVKEVKDLPILKGKSSYICDSNKGVSCADMSDIYDKPCGDCKFKRDKDKLLTSNTGVVNTMLSYVLKDFRHTQIYDEAHNLKGFLADLSTLKIWKKKDKYPDNINCRDELLAWLEDKTQHKKEQLQEAYKKEWDAKDIVDLKREYEKWERVFYDLQVCYTDFFIEEKLDLYYGKEEPCLVIKPQILRNIKAKLWNDKVHKLILMSATISEKDIKLLGLSNKRVAYIEADSPIPVENRPLYIEPVAKFNYTNREMASEKIAKRIDEIIDKYPSDKGIIHCTYSSAKLLKKYLKSKRIKTFDSDNREEVYKKFLRSRKSILLAPACQEGLDLKDDLARFQIIAKVNYPSLADNYIKKMLETDSDLYAWETVRSILQAYGRIVRTPADYGDTYILDSSFLNTFSRYKDMFPLWFRSAITLKRR